MPALISRNSGWYDNLACFISIQHRTMGIVNKVSREKPLKRPEKNHEYLKIGCIKYNIFARIQQPRIGWLFLM